MSNLNKAITHSFASLTPNGSTDYAHHLANEDTAAEPEAIQDYEDIQNSPEEKHHEYGTHGLEGISSKAVYRSKDTGRKFLVKDYHTNTWNLGDGFGEALSSALYKAGNIHHLIQRSHTTTGKDIHGGTGPVTVIHMEPHVIMPDDLLVSPLTHAEIHAMHPDKMKIEAMDWITGNIDRHHQNFMFRTDPNTGRPTSLLAIDNGGFYYHQTKDFKRSYMRDYGFHDDYDQVHADDFSKWWRERSPFIRLTFHKQVPHIKDPSMRDHITNYFDARCAHLDRVVDDYLKTGYFKL